MMSSARSMPRRWLISVAGILLLLVSSLAATSVMMMLRPKPDVKETEPFVFNVEAFEIQVSDVQRLLMGFGTVRADQDVTLAAQVAGEIIETSDLLEVGAMVSAGMIVRSQQGTSEQVDADTLLRIDPVDYQQLADQASNRIEESQIELDRLTQLEQNLERQLKKATTDLTTLTDEYDRVSESLRRGAGSSSEVARALMEVQRFEDSLVQFENELKLIPHQKNVARQRMASARTDLAKAQLDVQRTAVTARFDARVSEVLVEEGQYVRAGEPLVRLTAMDRVEIPIALVAGDYLALEQAMRDGAQPVAHLAQSETEAPVWEGRVVRVAPEMDSTTRTVAVYIEVDNSRYPDRPLLPGTFVHARIEGSIVNQAIVIPRDAVVGDQVFVLNRENAVRLVDVAVRQRLQSLAIVEGGLSAGDRIVQTNLDIIEDGLTVEVMAVSKLEDELAKLRTPALELLSAPQAVDAAATTVAPATAVESADDPGADE